MRDTASERKSLDEPLDISALSTVLSVGHALHPCDYEHSWLTLFQAEFPLLDQPLIIAILSDHDPNTLDTELPNIRDQLGILEASLVPDLDETLPPDLYTTDGLADSVGSIVLDESRASPTDHTSALGRNGMGAGTGSSALSRTTSTSDSGLIKRGDDSTGTGPTSVTGDEGGLESPGEELELLQNLFPSLYASSILNTVKYSCVARKRN